MQSFRYFILIEYNFSFHNLLYSKLNLYLVKYGSLVFLENNVSIRSWLFYLAKKLLNSHRHKLMISNYALFRSLTRKHLTSKYSPLQFRISNCIDLYSKDVDMLKEVIWIKLMRS